MMSHKSKERLMLIPQNVRRRIATMTIPAVLLFATGCMQLSAEEQKAEHLKRAKAFVEAEKYPEALIEYKNVVQIDPKDADSHYQLAQIYMKLGEGSHLQEAFSALSRTVELDPTIQDAQLKLGEFYLMARKSEKAREHADMFLASAPLDPKGHILRGRSLIIEKEFDQGIEEFKKSIELDPENVQIYVDIARAFRH